MVKTYRRKRNRSVTVKVAAQATKKRRTVKRRKSTAMVSSGLKPSSFAYANGDPFCEGAMGCRVPDMSTTPSTAFHTVDLVGIATNAGSAPGGGAGVPRVFLPKLACLTFSSNTTLGGDNSWTFSGLSGTASAKQSAVAGDFSLIRPVAWGVRLNSPVSKLNAFGTVHVCYFPMSFAGANFLAPLTVSAMQEMPGYQRFPLSALCESTVNIVGKFLDTSAFLYEDPGAVFQNNTSTATSAGLLGWYGIMVALDKDTYATASTTIVNCEVVIHWEGQENIGASGAVGLIQTHEHPDLSEMQRVSSASATAPGIFAGDSTGHNNNILSTFLSHYAKHTTRLLASHAARATVNAVGSRLR